MQKYLEYPNKLGLTEWEHPPYYGGFSPVGDFLAAVKTRDSGLLERTNWDIIVNALAELNQTHEAPQDPELESGDENYFYTFVARHWACGWVEYAMVRRDAPDEYQELLYEFESALAGYPILDETAYCVALYEEIYSIWDHAGLRDRMEYCRQAGVSIFASRREVMPDQVYGILENLVD